MATFNFGERQSVESLGRGVQLSCDGYPKAKPGGAEFKWDSVTALAADTYLTDQLRAKSEDGTFAYTLDDSDGGAGLAISGAFKVKAGKKVLRYGTPIMEDADGKFVLATAGGVAKRGQLFLVNETVVFDPALPATQQIDPKSLYPIAIDGGRVWEARILSSDNNVIGKSAADGTDVTVAGLPSQADILAALPGIFLARTNLT